MITDLFESIHSFPDPDTLERYQRLVGLDEVKERLEREAEAMLRADLLDEWSKKFHGQRIPALEAFERRPPLFIFAGDVGTGKTELAMTFGDRIARETRIEVEMYSLSLRSRGSGAVGEMTKLVSEAFRVIKEKCPKRPTSGKKPSGAMLLVIDEADSLAQSRELAQMHHEDRAGVNALIRGIDELASSKLPVLTVMCTNRLSALDPAVRRRAAAVFEFTRPGLELRVKLLEQSFAGTSMSSKEIAKLADELGPTKPRDYGFTFSDITQRFVPSVVLAAYPNTPITFDIAAAVLKKTLPTPPFLENRSD